MRQLTILWWVSCIHESISLYNMWFWCAGNCCDKEIVVFCPLGGLKATTGWLKLLSRFILIRKSPLVSRVALTLALEVLESMMKTWVLDFVQKVFFSMSFSICHWTWEKVALLNCFFNFMHPWDCMTLVCVHYWTFYVEDAWITLSLRNIRLGHVRHG